ncbi:MAG TPA: S1 RNA-binding domain-containing protein [Anaerolineae bacterium]|nr:S1 RNA-binding domain-containing protein [Anaerolineae bacterium]
MKGVVPITDMSHDSMGMLLEQYLETKRCRRGDIVRGVVVSASEKAILIDVGGKCDAVVHPRELEQMAPQELLALKAGQPVNVYIIEDSDDNDVISVSLARAAQQNDWDRARQLMRDNEMVILPVIDVNKGGVIVRLGQLRGFVPGSQLISWRSQQNDNDPEHRWNALLGERLKLRVIEVTSERNRLILSERTPGDSKSGKRKALEQLEIGSIHRGTVSNIVAFGAFVNVNGVDGLLHISELSWKRVNHPKEVVHVGQELDVYILDVELEKGRLGLSLKRITPDPWDNITSMYQEGQLVEVKIVNLTTFGAFAAFVDTPEIEGLIHISELSAQTIAHPGESVKVGMVYPVRIISLQPQERRIAFSLKQAQEPPSPVIAGAPVVESAPTTESSTTLDSASVPDAPPAPETLPVEVEPVVTEPLPVLEMPLVLDMKSDVSSV